MLSVGSLFSGIGGWDLGLERAGMRVVWQCENDPFARSVLRQHWPSVARYDDVRALVAPGHAGDLPTPDGSLFGPRPAAVDPVDVICGGFPCQDISPAGKRVGIGGARSGLWAEMFRLVRALRPRYVLVENSGDLAVRGLDRVLGDLASIGFDAEWEELSACAFGAPHPRKRLFVVAYADGEHRRRECGRIRSAAEGQNRWNVYPWDTTPGSLRVAHGLPAALDRNRALGNALIPDIAEHIGRRILEWEGLT